MQDQAFKRNSDAAYRTAMRQGVLVEGDSEEHIAGFLKARHIAGYGGTVKVVQGKQAATDDYGTSSYDYYNDIALNRDRLDQLLIIEERFKGIPYQLPVENELRPGEANLSVKALQESLKLVGAVDANGRALEADGDYGKSTREAVSLFQERNNLPATGTADIVTLTTLRTHAAALSATPDFQQVAERFQPPGYRNDWMQPNDQGLPSYLQAPTSTASTRQPRDAMADGSLKVGEQGQEVAKLQENLIQLGINDRIKQPITADGVFGPATQRAVQAFQLWHGTEQVNGVADRQTLAAISTQAGLAIVQRAADQVSDRPARDFAANVNLGRRIDPESAADRYEANRAPHAAPLFQAPASGSQAPAPISPVSSPARIEPTLTPSRLAPEDQAMFDKIRQNVPAQVADEKVAQAMLQAKQNGIPDAGRIGRIGVVDGTLWIAGVVPGFHAGVSTSEPAPPMQGTLRANQSFNQERDQQHAQNLAQHSQEDPSRGPRQ
ncbi:peptidoglycan-binding domain-containing protein [Lysobacter sp. CA196]|uniref:peptidoglycan-binding domain-containing protein n=1 Tax=Lysobacter sp. CA196 TaxID=3455606 RepID=UPI003F8D2DF0